MNCLPQWLRNWKVCQILRLILFLTSPRFTLFYFRLEYPDEESMLQYLDYFSKDAWRALPAVEKSEHKYFHCNVCTNDHFDAYSLFSRNSKILWRIYWRKATFEEKLKTWLKIKDKVKVSKYGGRTATPEEQVKIDAAKAKKQALLDEAAQTPSQQQPTQNGSEQKYVIQHDRYDFSRYQVTQQIRSCSELKIKVNWNALSRQYPVTTEDGRVVGMGYGARVIRAYAESMRLI